MARDRSAVPRWAAPLLAVLVAAVLGAGFLMSQRAGEVEDALPVVAAERDVNAEQRDAAVTQVVAFAAQVRAACAAGTLPADDPLCGRAVQVQAAPIPASVPGTPGTPGATGATGAAGAAGLTPPCYFTPTMCQGRDGRDGIDGAAGRDGTNGIDGRDGVNGADGADGIDGRDGCDAGTTRDPAGICQPDPAPDPAEG